MHVDLVFSTAKFGGNPKDEIEFEIRLRRCELVVIFVDAAKAKISTIARTSDDTLVTRKQTDRLSYGLEGSAKVAATSTSLPSFDADAKGSFGKSTDRIDEVSRVVRDFIVQHGMTADRHPRWDIKKRDGSALEGSPWDAKAEPRIKFAQAVSKINDDPYVRLEVRCRREDLDFGPGIRLKNSAGRKSLLIRRNKDANLAAAEQYLKKLLLEEGLPVANIDHRFGEITLADVVISVD